jgi:hypothetical protein
MIGERYQCNQESPLPSGEGWVRANKNAVTFGLPHQRHLLLASPYRARIRSAHGRLPFTYLCLLLAFLAVNVSPAFAQSDTRIGALGGTVEVFDGNSWSEAGRAQLVSAGQRVRTSTASFAYVVLGSGKAVTLGADTEIELRDPVAGTVFLQRGVLDAVSDFDVMTVVTNDGTLQSETGPFEMRITDRNGASDVTVVRGAVGTGSMVFRSDVTAGYRTYRAGGKSGGHRAAAYVPIWFYPYIPLIVQPGGRFRR